MPTLYFVPWLSISENENGNGSINTGQDIANPSADNTLFTSPNTLNLTGPITTIDILDTTDGVLQDEFNFANQLLTAPYVDPNDPGNVNPIGSGVETLYSYTIRDLSDPSASDIIIYGLAIGGSGALEDTLDGFASTARLLPGVEYTIVDVDSVTNPSYSALIACFLAGTEVETPLGPREISTLKPGDLVCTKDNGAQPLRWVGQSSVSFEDGENAHLRPICLRAGALGPNVPSRDLRLSPQHRVLVTSRIAERMFDSSQVLVAAKQMAQASGIEVDRQCSEATYVHLLFDQHEIVTTHGLESESLYLGQQALKSLSPMGRCEIAALFPALTQIDPARPFVPGRRARQLVMRHCQNEKSFVQRAVG